MADEPETVDIGIVTALRRATAAPHRAIEQQGLVRPLVTATDLDRSTCAHVLQAFYGWYAAVEAAGLEQRAAAVAGASPYRYRARAPLLAADVGELGLDPATAPTPPAFDRPALDTAAGVLGVLYVIEGAARGATVVTRHIEQIPALRASFRARFFRLASDHPAHWANFVALIEAASVAANQTPLLDSACQTFASLHRHLDRCQASWSTPAEAG